MNAKEVRQKIREAGLFQYEVAYLVGINEATFVRWLRKPLDTERAASIQAAIDRLAAQKGGASNGTNEDNR